MTNLTGGTAKMLPNHHITKPAFIGEIQGDGKIKVRWSSEQSIPGDAWADDLPGGEYLISNWQDEKIDCGKFNTKTNTCNRWPYQR